MRWACFSLLVLALLGLFCYEIARRERSWDGAPEEEERGLLTEGKGDEWLDPLPWLWRRGIAEEAAGPGFQRMRRGRRRLLRGEGSASGRRVRRRGRGLQLLGAGALRPFEEPANFTTAGLRIAPPYGALSRCVYVCVRWYA
jgi:hypothetical protein